MRAIPMMFEQESIKEYKVAIFPNTFEDRVGIQCHLQQWLNVSICI